MTCSVAIALLAAQTALATAPKVATPSATPMRDPVRMAQLQRVYESARVRRDIGWGMAGIGMALAAAGAVTVIYAFNLPGSSMQSVYDQVAFDIIAGSATIAIGVALAIPGAALALQGQSAMTDAKWLMGGTPAAAAIVPVRGGAMASLSFRF